MTTLALDGIGKSYEKGRWALREVSLRMEGGVWGFVGPNGAGKTTLLRILATLLEPTQGTVTWEGQDTIRHPETLRRDLGYLPQDFGIYPQLTGREFLRYIGELKRLPDSDLPGRVDAALDMVNLMGDADRRLRSYSGGMVQRLGIAQALLSEPHVLILDEPTVGLDPAERVRFRELIASLPGDRLVVLSTHIITDVEAMATNLVLVQKGHLLWNGTPAALEDDAAGTVWEIILEPKAFEELRSRCQVSQAIRRRNQIQARVIATERPHPAAISAEPTLEEAYLYLSGEATATEAGNSVGRQVVA